RDGGGRPRGAPHWRGSRHRPGAGAPPGRVRPWQTDADREGPGRADLGRPIWRDTRLADRDADLEPRLAELADGDGARAAAGGADGPEAQAGLPPATRPRRPRRDGEVRPIRRSRHPRARFGPG